MFIAKELRKTSIAEYLLYMWQVEDMIRAMGCSLPLIKKAYVSKFTDYTEEQKEEELDWFGNLVRMLNEEGKREQGHLNINTIVVKDMADLHSRMLQSNKFPIYSAEYYKVLPFIVELRNRGDKDVNEIETCLDVLYGIMLLRIQKKEITPETEHAIKEISTFIGLLSDYYIKDEKEGLDFGEDE
ncbi:MULTISPECIES: DUF4924 family protein [Prevotella]|uniref:DUF4924 domain-containing protein n=1 Tax=Prevotella herbatica TaxID=2801997 RepID=A0ABN6EMX0_9BACT|nr:MULTISPECIES: DUF4924 family protein [Prevotella]MDN5554374.1 DUF4924 family protein [Prevotella sp.]BCS86163.1 DUF4924 domain-containing protein [Prevotella herbatica]